MTQRTEIEFFVMVDSDGQYEVATDEDRLMEAWNDNYGAAPNTRTYALSLSVPLPQGVAVSGAVPDDAEDGAAIELTVNS